MSYSYQIVIISTIQYMIRYMREIVITDYKNNFANFKDDASIEDISS